MKCKKCGYITRGKRALYNMSVHYKKKHPGSMKKKRSRRAPGKGSRDKDLEILIKEYHELSNRIMKKLRE